MKSPLMHSVLFARISRGQRSHLFCLLPTRQRQRVPPDSSLQGLRGQYDVKQIDKTDHRITGCNQFSYNRQSLYKKKCRYKVVKINKKTHKLQQLKINKVKSCTQYFFIYFTNLAKMKKREFSYSIQTLGFLNWPERQPLTKYPKRLNIDFVFLMM